MTSVLTRITTGILRLLIGLSLTVVLGGARPVAMDVVIEQLQFIGPRQWLALLAGPVGARLGRRDTTVLAALPETAGVRVPANDNIRSRKLVRAS
jgi:hypothetical protein